MDAKGKVFLVGAGPGAPDLLTMKAARLLANADVVLHDSLVGEGVLELISPAAQRVDVGKRAGRKLLTQDEINALLVSYAEKHAVIIRLKGGDPSLFGRAGEEIAALRDAGIDYEVVPGVSAAFGAAAAAGVSLTDRRLASQVLLTTFSRGSVSPELNWGVIGANTTVAIYMPGPDYCEVAARLIDAGVAADTPCVVVSQASSASQSMRWTSLATLHETERLPAPALLIVGRVASRNAAELESNFSLDLLERAGSLAVEGNPWGRN